MARALIVGQLIPRITWALQAWWNNQTTVLTRLQPVYHSALRWIADLPYHTSTRILTQLISLPPLKLLLDYFSRRYALFFYDNQHARPMAHEFRKILDKLPPTPTTYPSLISLAHMFNKMIPVNHPPFENKQDTYQMITEPVYKTPIPEVKPDPKSHNYHYEHLDWLETQPLEPGDIFLYTDGSKTAEGHTGSG